MFKSFSQYTMLLITLNAMHVASSAITFFFYVYVSPLAGIFLDKFPLQDFFFFLGGGGVFLMVRPLLIHKEKQKKVTFIDTAKFSKFFRPK